MVQVRRRPWRATGGSTLRFGVDARPTRGDYAARRCCRSRCTSASPARRRCVTAPTAPGSRSRTGADPLALKAQPRAVETRGGRRHMSCSPALRDSPVGDHQRGAGPIQVGDFGEPHQKVRAITRGSAPVAIWRDVGSTAHRTRRTHSRTSVTSAVASSRGRLTPVTQAIDKRRMSDGMLR